MIDKIQIGVNIASMITAVVIGVGAVLLTNILQNKKLRDSLISQTASGLEVFRATMEGSLKNFQIQINGNGKVADEKLKSFVTWEKYDIGISRVHDRMEANANEQRECLQEISDSVHQIEIATTEIGTRLESQQQQMTETREWVTRVEDKVDKRNPEG